MSDAGSGQGAATPPPTLATEPHERGGFLVAAVFDAFVTIYERRTADLIRLARRSSSPGDDVDLPPELVDRLADEAAKAADHVLRMCVRALDYLPPVALRFGEYLRAIITADNDLVPEDPLRYRVAFVEAFRKRRITVPGCISVAPDSLLWAPPDRADYRSFAAITGTDDDPLSAMFAGLLAQLQLSVAFDGRGDADGGAERRVAYTQTDFGARATCASCRCGSCCTTRKRSTPGSTPTPPATRIGNGCWECGCSPPTTACARQRWRGWTRSPAATTACRCSR